MKHFLRAFFLLCVLSLGAYTHSMPDGWAVEAEYLYLLPSVDDTYFVTSSSYVVGGGDNPGDGKRINNDFGFHSGFRVGGSYGFCDCGCELQGYYTYLNANTSASVSGPYLLAPDTNSTTSFSSGFAGGASSHLHLLYQRADALFFQKGAKCCRSAFFFLGGLEYGYIRLNRDVSYFVTGTGEKEGINQQSKIWGVGPEVGLEYDYTFRRFTSPSSPSHLAVIVGASASILASKETNSLSSPYVEPPTAPVTLSIVDDSTWRLIPVAHIRVGLGYELDLRRMQSLVEVGYEFNSYFRALKNTLSQVIDDARLQTENYLNFDLQGLYVMVSLVF